MVTEISPPKTAGDSSPLPFSLNDQPRPDPVADAIAIMAQAEAHKLPVGFARKLVEEQVSPAQATIRMIDERGRIADETAIRNIDYRGHGTGYGPTVTGGADHSDPAFIRESMEEAATARALGKKPSDRAWPYMHRRTLDCARELVEARGVRNARSMSDDAVLERAMAPHTRLGGLHTTSDFAQLLTGVGNRVLLEAYQAAESPLKTLARQTSVNDFRAKNILKVSGLPVLKKVLEHGEIERSTRVESSEGYKVDTHASIFGITRQAIINDDTGAFTDGAVVGGRAAAETEASLLVALFTANSGAGVTLRDGTPWHHLNRANRAATGTAIDTAALTAARLAMRNQKDIDGVTPISVRPKYLLVSAAQETPAEVALSVLAAATPANVNPFSGQLQILVDVHLAGNGWYVFADKVPTIEYAYLSGNEGPQVTTKEGWDVLGLELRVVLDFGCGVVDHRGSFYNPGQP